MAQPELASTSSVRGRSEGTPDANVDRGSSVDYERAHAAIEALRALELPPNAVNVALWDAHLGGENPALSEAVLRLAKRPAHATLGVCHALYVKHLMPNADLALQFGDLIEAQLKKASSALAAVDHDVTSYGVVLRGAATALDEPLPAGAMKALVLNMAKATEQVRSRALELERKLAETTSEVTSLHNDLLKVRVEAVTDALTGLANRKRFDEFLDASIRRARPGSSLSLIVCDIDHFKRVNDTWGHSTGDGVIQFIGGVLEAHARVDDLVARQGGEEFAIIATETTAAECAQIAEAARRAIASKMLKRRSTGEDLGLITASFGVAELAPGQDAASLMERADAALYASKNGGRNRVTLAAEQRKPPESA